ncbi:MAG: GspH/FimT family pseudopilin [Thiohalomonadales bacterium]
MSHKAGFTLIELVVVLSIAAIITTVALPSFNALVKNNRATSQANEVLSAIKLTRSEAIKRSQRMTLCPRANPRTDPETCSNSNNWATGALVFSDVTGTIGTFDTNDVMIKVMSSLSGASTLTSTGTTLQYLPSGDVASAVTLTLIMNNCTGKQSKEIRVTLTGRGKINSRNC